MSKRSLLSSLILFGCLVFVSCPAQAETISITTYYPAPYGVYKDFEVKGRAAVGDITAEQPVDYATGSPITDIAGLQDGELWVQDSVIFEPQINDPTIDWDAGKAGELAFSAEEGKFYYYNGSDWVASNGGGGGVVISLKCAWKSAAVLGSCSPLSCPTDSGWTEVGAGCVSTSLEKAGQADTEYVGYCERWCYKE